MDSADPAKPAVQTISSGVHGRPPVLPLAGNTGGVSSGRYATTPLGATPLRRIGATPGGQPEASPSLRQPSLVWPPTPSPVSHLGAGWGSVFGAQHGDGAAAAPTGEIAFAPMGQQPVAQPMYQPQVFWQVPMMMPGQAQMIPMHSGMQMQMQHMQHMQMQHLPMAGNNMQMAANGMLVAAAPIAQAQAAERQVVQGDVVQGVVVEESADRAAHGGSKFKQETNDIAAAGKQLFGEALDGEGLDNIQKHAEGVESMCGLTTGPVDSTGASNHSTGNCNPCAWFWKPRGCGSGARCPFCHLCPEGELKRRKKAKIAAIKMGILQPTNPRPEGPAPKA